MSDNRDTPGPTQQLLSGTTAHVGHICVVDREAKDPTGGREANHVMPEESIIYLGMTKE